MKSNLFWVMCLTASTLLSQTPALRSPQTLSAGDRAALDQTVQVTVRVAPGSAGGAAQATIDLLNLSSKTITAFSYSVVAQYDDGKEWSQGKSLDVLSETINRERAASGVKVFGVGTLRSFETFQDRLALPPGRDGSPPILASAQVVAVVFDDRTALGDASEVQDILARRRAWGERWGAALADVHAAKADPTVQSLTGARERATALRTLIAGRMNELRKGPPIPDSSSRIELLKLFSDALSGSSDITFEWMLREQEASQAAVVEQSTLAVSK